MHLFGLKPETVKNCSNYKRRNGFKTAWILGQLFTQG